MGRTQQLEPNSLTVKLTSEASCRDDNQHIIINRIRMIDSAEYDNDTNDGVVMIMILILLDSKCLCSHEFGLGGIDVSKCMLKYSIHYSVFVRKKLYKR